VREREFKMTKVEAYKAVISGEINEEVVSKFEELLAAHESEGEKRRNRAAEKRAEKLAAEKVLEDGILAVLGTEPMTASDIRDAVEGIETPQKATVIAKRLVAAGLVSQTEVKGKSGKVKGYTLA
jgi:DNA-binding PadR family transcriptional regulator